MARLTPKFLPALVFLLTLACFLPAVGNGWVNWDDPHNFLLNPDYRGLGLRNLHWMFTTFHVGHYQPLAWITLGLDYTLWGMAPAGYHLTNVLLHAANALLFYFLVLALLRTASEPAPVATPLAAALGALLFALHPLRVEPVAWITERRDVLCAFFYLLTILAYLRHAHDPRRRWLILSIACFACSLLSKAWGITMPLVLIALDVFPLRRRAWLEKVPYAALAIAAAIAALWGVHEAFPREHGVVERAMQVPYGLGFYLAKTVAPVGLSPLYPLSGFRAFAPATIALAAIAVAGAAALVVARKRFPAGACAGVAYVLILAPVLGVAQSGLQAVADRYTYLACLPWMVLIAAGLEREMRRSAPVARAAAGAAVLVVAFLASLTLPQIGIWRDSESLWTHALKVNPRSETAWLNRGLARAEKGDLDNAASDLDTSLAIDPRQPLAYNARASVRLARGDGAGALADYAEALRLQPEAPLFWRNRADARRQLGDLDGAIDDLTKGIAVRPDAALFFDRALIRLAKGDAAGARADLDEAIAREPRSAAAFLYRARVRRATDEAGALADLDRAVELDPASPAGWYARGVLRQQRGDLIGAAADFSRAVAVHPGFADALRARAQLRRLADDRPGALADYTAAIAAHPRDADAHFGRALVFEELRDPESALAGYTAAIAARADFADAHFRRAALLARFKKWDAAVADLDVVTRLRPADAAAFALRGDARAAKEDWKGAVADYETAQKLGADVTEKLNAARAK